MGDIKNMTPASGRLRKENNQVINVADLLEAVSNNGIKLSGNIVTKAPETGTKTVTTTAAEIFAGTSVLANRDKLIVYNEGTSNVYWGKAGLTVAKGFPLLPGDSIVFSLDPSISTPIFFIAESSVPVRVGELA